MSAIYVYAETITMFYLNLREACTVPPAADGLNYKSLFIIMLYL